jgi:hypothetical protein
MAEQRPIKLPQLEYYESVKRTKAVLFDCLWGGLGLFALFVWIAVGAFLAPLLKLFAMGVGVVALVGWAVWRLTGRPK